MRDYYDILGVPSHADQQAIDDAYRRLSRQYDLKSKRNDKTGDTAMRDIDIAHRTLRDAGFRQAYDAGRSQFTVIERRADKRLSFFVVVGASVLTSIILWTALVHAGIAHHLMVYTPTAIIEQKKPATSLSADETVQHDAAAQPLRAPAQSPPQTAQIKPQEQIVPMARWQPEQRDQRVTVRTDDDAVNLSRAPTSPTAIKPVASAPDGAALKPSPDNFARHSEPVASATEGVASPASGKSHRQSPRRDWR